MAENLQRIASDDLNAEFQAFLKSPEYRAAVAREDENRDFPFMDLPELVCGIELRPITMLDLSVHFHLRSPFLASSFRDGTRKPIDHAPPSDFASTIMEKHIIITQGEIARFLWVQSTDFVPATGSRIKLWRAERARRAFVRSKCRSLRYGQSCDEIRGLINGTLADKPSGGSGLNTESVTGWIASEVFFVCKHLSWSESDVLNMPLKRLFQYERKILESIGERSCLANNSAKLRSNWLRKARERTAKN